MASGIFERGKICKIVGDLKEFSSRSWLMRDDRALPDRRGPDQCLADRGGGGCGRPPMSVVVQPPAPSAALNDLSGR